MDKNPESKLIQTIKTKKDSDLSMTGKLVLVQNALGIFFGTLEKINTKDKAALLSDGYMISPERHITFTQFLNFRLKDVEAPDEDSPDGRSYALMPGVQPVTVEEFEQLKINTITDYATEGIKLVQRGEFDSLSVFRQQTISEQISLTGVQVIVPLVETATVGDVLHFSPHYVVHELNDSAREDWEEIEQIKIVDTFMQMINVAKSDNSEDDTMHKMAELIVENRASTQPTGSAEGSN